MNTLPGSRKYQLALVTFLIYASTIFVTYLAIQSSSSYLQVTIKLTKGLNVIILVLFSLLNVAFIWKGLTYLLFGELRLIEYEHIIERLPFIIINFCLLSSMFNERDIIMTISSFGLILVFMKVSHWILKDRLEILLQSMNDSTDIQSVIFSNRFFFNMGLFFIIDYQMISSCLTNSIQNSMGASTSIHLLLSVEFTMLLVDLINLSLHTCLNLYEFYKSLQDHTSNTVGDNDNDLDEDEFNGLEGKFMYEKAIDLFTRFLKTLLHVLMLIPFRMKIVLLKDVIWDLVALYQHSASLWRTWRNNKQLDDKLPTVSLQELKSTDNNICIVCMDNLIYVNSDDIDENISEKDEHYYNSIVHSKQKPKKLPCGHVLHLSCLKNWMERSQTCPICRLAVFDNNGNILPFANSRTERNNTTVSTEQTVDDSNNHTNDESNNEAPHQITATHERVGDTLARDINFRSVIGGGPIDTVEDDEYNPDDIFEHQQPSISSIVGTEELKKAESRFNNVKWKSFPITAVTNDSISFNIVDSNIPEKEIPLKLIIEEKQDIRNSLNPKQIVIKNKDIRTATDSTTIKNLKEKINELESQINEINSKMKK